MCHMKGYQSRYNKHFPNIKTPYRGLLFFYSSIITSLNFFFALPKYYFIENKTDRSELQKQREEIEKYDSVRIDNKLFLLISLAKALIV